ncbi:MAG: hypothetical protein GWP14_03950 [Actinobacteria bacterium]|nr:hypothetical protein [Actinomycetota bacterium]
MKRKGMNMCNNRLWLLTKLCGMILLLAAPARGANCALRNPDRRIYAMFPEATSYRSLVAKVDNAQKRIIEEVLGAPLVFSDLGKHTMYIVMKDAVPIGFVHARSEIGKSGLIEFVWAMDLDLRIFDFAVQRGRERHLEVIKGEVFRGKLIGKGSREMRSLLSADAKTVDTRALGIPQSAGPVAHSAVLSGAKALTITAICFSDPLLKARLMGNVYRFFPSTVKVTKVKAVLDADSVASIKKLTGSEPRWLQPQSLVVLRSLDESGKTLGLLVFCEGLAKGLGPQMWWTVSADGLIREAIVTGLVSQEVTRDFSRLRGKDLDQLLQLQQVSEDELEGTARSGPKASGNPTRPPAIDYAVEVLAILKVNSVIR